MNAQSKVCFKCGVCKPLELYYVHPRMADGHLNKCKACTRSDAKKHRSANLDRIRDYEKSRSSLPHLAARRAAHIKAWQESHKDRRQAQNLVNSAVKSGRLTPWPFCAVPECRCRPEAHHPDYTRPLDVVWLCRSHHQQAHAMTRVSATALEEAGYEVDAAGTFTG